MKARTGADRLLSAFPLGFVFVSLCLVYAWLAWRHGTPWLFGDELEFTQISRAIADTGHAARRGVPYSSHSLYSFLIAPAWRIGDTHTAYATAKYIGVVTMSATVFPAYALARLVTSPRAALVTAAAAASIPALAYSSLLVAEPLAYPYSTLCLFLIAKALLTRRWPWIVGAAVAAIVAPEVRGELGVLSAVYILAALFLLWRSERAARWRAGWSRWDWAGFVALLVGAVVAFDDVVGRASLQYLIATRFYKGRMLELGLWAGGAFTIGLGVLPVVAGLAAPFRPRAERTPGSRAFGAVFAASLIAFGLYTAVKAAYLSTVFATRVEERNLIYLAPLFFAATALWLDRPRLRLVPFACATGFAAYLIVATPYQLDVKLYSDAPGLSILQMANRELAFTPSIAQWTMLAVLAVSVALLLAPRLLARRQTAVGGLLALAAVLAVAWNVAGSISAGRASNTISRVFLNHLPSPLDWVDRADGGEPAIYLGQQITDPDGIHQLEFWNRSLKHVWSLDGTAPGPGPTLTPDLIARDGSLTDPGVRWVVADNGVNLVGTVVRHESHWRLYRLSGPLRLANAVTGVFSDGWFGCPRQPCAEATSAYSQFAAPGGRPGLMAVSVGRGGWRGPDKPGRVTIKVGRLVIGPDHQPAIGTMTATRTWIVHSGIERRFLIPTPPPPIRVEITVSPTFSPHDYGASDPRGLGAQVGYAFVPRKAAQR